MDNLQTWLAELVCTRISHDLIGNIGAINNVLEILPDANGAMEEGDLSVLETAAATLSARQQFFRLAFGLETEAIGADKLKQICRDYLHFSSNRNYPIEYECNKMMPKMAKVLCLCLMIGAEVCLRGGHINIVVDQKLAVEVTSENALSQPKIEVYKQILDGKYPSENPAQYVQLLYLRSLLGENVPMELQTTAEKMILTIG